MSYEIPPIRFYYRREGQAVVLRSADPSFVVNVVAGPEAFEDLRRRNPHATFESESPSTSPQPTTRPNAV
jgi:hypothetical protein